ncbi:hypothetical protein QTN25_006996 [Entamoeba marina]
MQEFKQQLPFDTWTCIFSSEKDEMSSRCLWSKIRGRKHIILLFETSNDVVFGSYHSIIPPSQNVPITDENHFIFSTINSLQQFIQFFPTNKQSNSLKICHDLSTTVIFYINGFCDIRNNGKSWCFSNQFPGFNFIDNYDDQKQIHYQLLYDHCFPSNFDLKYLNVYELI